jgi:hypothetical protein
MPSITIHQAIEKAQKGESLEGFAIQDLAETQIKVKEALLLAEFGIVVPEQNIYYDDKDIAYDPDFDDVTWTRLPNNLSLEEQAKMAATFQTIAEQSDGSGLTVQLQLEGPAKEWALSHQEQIQHLINRYVADLYEASVLHK